jgi:hypothetical protein
MVEESYPYVSPEQAHELDKTIMAVETSDYHKGYSPEKTQIWGMILQGYPYVLQKALAL